MEKYKVLIFSAAIKDLEDIIDYINALSGDAAIKQYDSITKQINSLSEMPMRCPLVKDDNLRRKGYRGLIVDNYVVYYLIKNKEVQIYRIIHGKRRYEWLL